MIKPKKVLLIACLLAASIAVFAKTDPAPLPVSVEAGPDQTFIDQKVNTLMRDRQIPGLVVTLYVEGKPYEYYYGFADKEKKITVERKTIFEIGSISKIMTSLLLAQEIDWAKMSLNDPITTYISDLPQSYNKIKLQDLATYTSGLPFDLPENVKTKEALDLYLSHLKLSVSPGQQWIYSNIGMGLLAQALENSTEKDFDNLYRRHVLNPLNMVTGASVAPKLMKYYAEGYDKEGNVAPRVATAVFPSAFAIKASAADMQRFLAAAIGLPGTPVRVFYPMRMTESIYVKLPGRYQGLGWQIHTLTKKDITNLLNVPTNVDPGPVMVQQVYARPLYNSDTLIDKTGSTAGFRAYIAVLPSKKSGIVVLANKAVPNGVIVKIAREILFHVAL